MDDTIERPVLILGAGINGAAVARELLLNGVPVWLVDAQDVACGATSRSSRLIHGGLRYLEYGDFKLVRESLAERARLRKLAPQFVERLRLHIPVVRRTGGLIGSALRFLGAARSPFWSRLFGWALRSKRRGLWVIRLGLWLYDRLAPPGDFDRPSVVSRDAAEVPHVNPAVYRWQCVYGDGRMMYPERFVIAMLEDARRLAEQHGVEFRLLTYHRANLEGDIVDVHSVNESEPSVLKVTPAAIVNATGAWGDFTLNELKLSSRRLFGGTKGSHFLTHQPRLREALGDGGVYAEADDGRLIFVLPFGSSVLVGTTDERFDERPEQAVASEDELRYLIDLVNDLFPQAQLTLDDVDMHYSGVRPLPYQAGGKTGAIPRGHWIERNDRGAVPVLTLIGGKLTTCRALAEQVVAQLAGPPNSGRPVLLRRPAVNSRERVFPGGEDYPGDEQSLDRERRRLADKFGLKSAQIQTLWPLYGTRVETHLDECGDTTNGTLPGTAFPLAFVRWVIEHEWVRKLDDLIERRMMLLFQPDLSVETLRGLARLLVEAGRLDASQVDAAVDASRERLRTLYGKHLAESEMQRESTAAQASTE